MTTLACRNIAKDCTDTLTASDSQGMQKMYLQHVHAKHSQQWGQFSQQYKAVAVVAMRDRFRAQPEDVVKVEVSGSPE